MAESIAASVWLDTQNLAGKRRVVSWITAFGPFGLRWALTAAAGYSAFCGSRVWRVLAHSGRAQTVRSGIFWLVLHGASAGAFAFLSLSLFDPAVRDTSPAVAAAWMCAALAAVLCGMLTFVPLRTWPDVFQAKPAAAVLAGSAVCTIVATGSISKAAWSFLIGATFSAASALLRTALPHVVANASTYTLGTDRFAVDIAPECSGLQGMVLAAGFVSAWLFAFRKEYRFPSSLVLLPASVGAMWCLNVARIAVLIVIGHLGFESIALGGFHSQAGWLGFLTVSLGFLVVSRRMTWFSTAAPAKSGVSTETNPAAAYLGPFLAIMAASLVSQTASGGFEWLYPLRLVAACGALYAFRGRYRSLDWRCTWVGPAAGLVAFALWMALDKFVAGAPGSRAMALDYSNPAVLAWVACRAAAGVITVPVAEELAFRAFLVRRLKSADFESLSPRAFTWMSLAVSSLVFGALHGRMWMGGTVVGLLYAWAFVRRGRFGDAVAAHAVTNALVAVLAIRGGRPDLW